MDIWSSDQVADWLLTVSPDPLYIQYAETFKRMYMYMHVQLRILFMSPQTNYWNLIIISMKAEHLSCISGHRIRGANLSRLDFRLLTCMGVTSVGHQIDILQVGGIL